MLAEFLYASLSLFEAALALKTERLGDNGDNKDFLVFIVVEVYALRNLGNDRCRTSACATTHTGGDEEHLRIVRDCLPDLISLVHGGLARPLGLVTGAETKISKRYLVGNRTRIKSLHIRVADDEVHTLDAFVEHVVHRIATAATNTDNLDVGRLTLG